MKDAEAEGVTIDRIEQTDVRILATYKYANGSTRTYAYQLLSAAGDVPAPSSNIASISNANAASRGRLQRATARLLLRFTALCPLLR